MKLRLTTLYVLLLSAYVIFNNMPTFRPDTRSNPLSGSKARKVAVLPTMFSLGRRRSAVGPRFETRHLSRLMVKLRIYIATFDNGATIDETTVSCPCVSCEETSQVTNKRFSKVSLISLKRNTRMAGGHSIIHRVKVTIGTSRSTTTLWPASLGLLRDVSESSD